MAFQTLATTPSIPPRTLRLWVDRTLFLAALLVIAATTFAAHPGPAGETFSVAIAGKR